MNAHSRISTKTTRLTMAARCRRKRRSTSWVWVRCLTVNSCSAGGSCVPADPAASMSVITDPRVEYGVEEIGEEVETDDDDGGEQQPRHGPVDIDGRGRLDEHLPHAVPLEDRLRDHCAAQNDRDVERGDGRQRDEGGAQRVPHHDRAAAQPLGTGETDV